MMAITTMISSVLTSPLSTVLVREGYKQSPRPGGGRLPQPVPAPTVRAGGAARGSSSLSAMRWPTSRTVASAQ
jgi:hypothetical protein